MVSVYYICTKKRLVFTLYTGRSCLEDLMHQLKSFAVFCHPFRKMLDSALRQITILLLDIMIIFLYVFVFTFLNRMRGDKRFWTEWQETFHEFYLPLFKCSFKWAVSFQNVLSSAHFYNYFSFLYVAILFPVVQTWTKIRNFSSFTARSTCMEAIIIASIHVYLHTF
jgi:hypothetical protein